jgi:putative oxidoreductase
MKKLTIIGRILFALPFGILGLNHFLMVNYYSGILTSFIPGGGFSVLLAGFAMIACSVSIIFEKFVKISCLTLAGLLLIYILTIHIPQLFNPATSTMAMIELLKDTALMGGSLIIAGLYKKETPSPFKNYGDE